VPTALIIAGPNGAGKTTFADEYLALEEREFAFVNADEISRELSELPDQAVRDVLAGRMMLQRLNEVVETGADFAVETTLATRIYARRIPDWRSKGYVVSLVYLRLKSAEESTARIRKRIAAGGHGIADEIARRRFGKSLAYLEQIYKPLVDEWYVWDSREGDFAPAEAWNRTRP
jgi:predicted ABC-type ATPase